MSNEISKFTFRMLPQVRQSLEAMMAKGNGDNKKESLNRLVNHAVNIFVEEIQDVETVDDLLKAQELISVKIEAYLKKSHLINIRVAKLLKGQSIED